LEIRISAKSLEIYLSDMEKKGNKSL